MRFLEARLALLYNFAPEPQFDEILTIIIIIINIIIITIIASLVQLSTRGIFLNPSMMMILPLLIMRLITLTVMIIIVARSWRVYAGSETHQVK